MRRVTRQGWELAAKKWHERAADLDSSWATPPMAPPCAGYARGDTMAERAVRFCAHRGCAELVRGGYCDKHKPMRQDNRESASRRGYDSRWQRFRLRYLSAHPLCEQCENEGVITAASLIHHKRALRDGGAKYAAENLMPLCRECHEIIEGRARGRGGQILPNFSE